MIEKMCKRMKNRQTQAGKGLMAGILMGLAVGVVAIGGVMYYLNNHKPSYDNLEKNQEQNTASTPALEVLLPPGASDAVIEFTPEMRAPLPVSEPIQSATNPLEVLEGGAPENLPPSATEQLLPIPTKPVVEKPVAEKLTTEKSKPKIEPIAKRSFLQAGAYKEREQAESQKAKLALLGIEAHVYEVDLGGAKGVLHRVRIGPFTNEQLQAQVRKDLNNNGVETTIVN